ncbi:MAG: RPA family protein [Methanoculleaceae archaeon]
MTQRTFEREPAKRVFAAELREARHQFRDGADDMSPTYVLLPTGERANRVFVVGSLTEKERRGGQNSYYIGRVADPTGVFFISAGSFQPEAMQEFARIDAPAFVSVIAKPNVYQAQDGAVRVSLRAESITPVDAETRNIWILDTAEQTLDRLDAFGTTEDSRAALEHYQTDTAFYRQMVYDALSQMEI